MTLRALAAVAALGLATLNATGVPAAELRLLMFEQAGCLYCARWRAEIGPEYDLTAEGRAAPLLRQDLRAPLPEGVRIEARPVFTPTFVLLRDGVEAGRIEGYPGEDFFWPLLAELIKSATLPPTD